MRSPARVEREAKEMSEALLAALQQAVRRSGVELKELSARTGRADGYFSHLFKGRINLSAENVFTVLLAIDVSPAAFFSGLYGQERPQQSETEEDEFEKRVLRAMERYGIVPPKRDEGEGGGSAAL